MLYGAVIGDIAGSPFEHDRGCKTKDFELFSGTSHFTDDTVMTAAVAEALLTAGRDAPPERITACTAQMIREWALDYPDAGYGSAFLRWIQSEDSRPYNSLGNGSAMRVSPTGWFYDTLAQTRAAAAATAMPTHNHEEGIKGAEAVASAIYLSRTGSTKEGIRRYITENFGYDLNRTCDDIRPGYHHDVTCAGSVPEAIIAFLDSNGFTDAVRNAVSLGGDTDTIAAIAGSIAEAYYGIPEYLIKAAKERIPERIRRMLACFARETICGYPTDGSPMALRGNAAIAEAAREYGLSHSYTRLVGVLEALMFQANRDKCLLVPRVPDTSMPASVPEDLSVNDLLGSEAPSERLAAINGPDGKAMYPAFTDYEAADGWNGDPLRAVPIWDLLKMPWRKEEAQGIVINPGRESFRLEKGHIKAIYRANAERWWYIPGYEEDRRPSRPDNPEEDDWEDFEGNEAISDEIAHFMQSQEYDSRPVIKALCRQAQLGRYVLLPVDPERASGRLRPDGTVDGYLSAEELCTCIKRIDVQLVDGALVAAAAYTDREQYSRSGHHCYVPVPMEELFHIARKLQGEVCFTINPDGGSGAFFLTDKILKDLFETYNYDYKCAPKEVNCLWPDVSAVRGSIAEAEWADAVVCETDNFLSPSATGAGRAVHDAANPGLAKACAMSGGCETGRTKATAGYGLPCRSIIHTATPEWQGGRYNEERYLARCYSDVLEKAAQMGAETVAFPPLSVGKGFSPDEAARIAISAVRDFLSLGSNFNRFRTIKWVIKDRRTLEAYKREITKVFRRKGANGDEDKGGKTC